MDVFEQAGPSNPVPVHFSVIGVHAEDTAERYLSIEFDPLITPLRVTKTCSRRTSSGQSVPVRGNHSIAPRRETIHGPQSHCLTNQPKGKSARFEYASDRPVSVNHRPVGKAQRDLTSRPYRVHAK